MTEIILRGYQDDGVLSIRKLISKGIKHILYQLPTGGGKTIIFSYIAIAAAKKTNKVLILTDREELLKQAGKSISNFGTNVGFIKAGAKYIDHRKNTFVAMSQTLRNRISIPEWREWILEDIDLVIIDEAHIQEFNYLFVDGILDDKIVLGFTATPQRTGKMRQLGLDYERLIRGAEPKDLINLGYLLNCDLYEFESPSMQGVSKNSNTGDYNSDQMYNKFNTLKLYKGLVANYEKYTPGKKMLVFCCNVEHAIKTTIELNNAGYKSKFICSKKTPPKPVNQNSLFSDIDMGKVQKYKEKLASYKFYEDNYKIHSGTRKRIFEGFANDEFTILVNVDIATKGYDEPSIEVIAVYRATNSLTLWLQMLGRGSRLFEGKSNFTVFDFGSNKQRLGSYDENRDWSLWHETTKDGTGVAPVKECGLDSNGKPLKSGNEIEKGCTRLIPISMKLCPFCGFKYPSERMSKEVELVLEEIIDSEGVSLAVKSFSKMDWTEIETYRKAKGHPQAWLWRQLWIRGGEEELKGFAQSRRWGNSATQRALNFCVNTLGSNK